MTSGNNMKTFCTILAVIGLLGLLYFGWAQHRMGPAGMLDVQWPRPFPYPDPWLNSLHDWFDERYPVPPDSLKIHGEIFRVRATLSYILVFCGALVATGVGPGLYKITKKRFPTKR